MRAIYTTILIMGTLLFPYPALSEETTRSLPVVPLHQMTNECGQTTLAMVLAYYNPRITLEQIRSQVNNTGSKYLGSIPTELTRIAHDNGYESRIVNTGTLIEVAKLIDCGIPVIVNGREATASLSQAHFMVATGYLRNAAGALTHIEVVNPASGTRYTIPAATFETMFWKNSFFNSAGSHLFVALAPAQSAYAAALPFDRYDTYGDGVCGFISLKSKYMIGEGVSDVLQGCIAVASGHALQLPAKIIGGMIKLLTGLPSGAIKSIGHYLKGTTGLCMEYIGNQAEDAGNSAGNRIISAGKAIAQRLSV